MPPCFYFHCQSTFLDDHLIVVLSCQMLSLQPPLPWETWQELREESVRNPESVFTLLLDARVSL